MHRFRTMSRFQKLALSTAFGTFALIAVGALVRATASGLGCPGWPKCFGRWVPPLEYHAIIEYSHRFLASVVVVLVGLLAVAAFRSQRGTRGVLWASAAAVVLVFLQAALGAIVVEGELQATMVTAHFATAMLLAAVLVYVFAVSFSPRAGVGSSTDAGFARLATVAAGATYVLLLIGAYVRGRGAGLAFPDWPLMNGRLVPALGGVLTTQFVHRVAAALVTLLVMWVAIRAWTMPGRPRSVLRLTNAVVALFAAQILVGAATVWSQLSVAAVVGHVTLAGLVWGTMVALATVSHGLARPAEPSRVEGDGAGEPGRRSLRESTAAYFQLTKPRIIILLLVTTVPAMVLAAGGMPSLPLVLFTLTGGAVAAGSANAVNCYLDRDVDEVMRRTRRRPLPAGRVSPESALNFGFVLGAISFFFLGMTVNVLAAALALSAIVFYVFVYTLWLKRTTTQNIVIGGAAGAIPALVGWAAVTGTVGLPAWILFAIVFVWTPPHFWALAMQYRGDYAAAGIPMLPVVRGEEETRRQILLYSLALFGTTLVLYPVAHMGPIYLATAVPLGGVFVFRALKLWRNATPALAVSLFRYSIVYLALLFGAVAADSLVPLR